jgi:hypothetical protein
MARWLPIGLGCLLGVGTPLTPSRFGRLGIAGTSPARRLGVGSLGLEVGLPFLGRRLAGRPVGLLVGMGREFPVGPLAGRQPCLLR